MSEVLTRASVQKEIIEAFKAEGLVLVPRDYAEKLFDLKRKQQTALKRMHLSSYKVAKLKLIDGITTNLGVKQYVKRNFLKDQHYYIDASGVMQILTSTIKAIRNE